MSACPSARRNYGIHRSYVTQLLTGLAR